jgi:tRNA threonylcarbamoyladenosine biosynthesis protein TsaB
VLSETTWLAGREHSTRLLVEVQVALERVGCSIEQVTGLVVARGPGSFTGVRVALSVAMGISAGLHVPVWGVSSLDVLALMSEPSTLPVRAVLEAGRGRYATGLYEGGVAVEPPSVATLEQLKDSVRGPTIVIGELDTTSRDLLGKVHGVRLSPNAANVRRAGFLAELGWRLAQYGEPGDPRTLDALYIT